MTWFRRRKPAVSVTVLSTSERLIAALCGYTPEQWAALTEQDRRDCRDTVAWEVRA